MTENAILPESKRIEIVANRIFKYYLDIIKYKKSQNVKSFVIDKIPARHNGKEMSLVTLEDKYDGKSSWRNVLGMLNEDADWYTIHDGNLSEFKKMGKNEKDFYSIDMEKVLPEVSILLSKNGVANYFEEPGKHEALDYFWEADESWLVIVL